MSQPGVIDVEFIWPQVAGVIIYDSSKTSPDQLVSLILEKTKREFVVTNDQPFQ